MEAALAAEEPKASEIDSARAYRVGTGKVKWVCYSPWLGLQFFAVLPVFQPSPDSGNSRESNGNSWESEEFPRSSSGVGNSTSLLYGTEYVVGHYRASIFPYGP